MTTPARQPVRSVVLVGLLALGFTATAAFLLRVNADSSHMMPDGAINRFVAQTLGSGRWAAPEVPVPESFEMGLVLEHGNVPAG